VNFSSEVVTFKIKPIGEDSKELEENFYEFNLVPVTFNKKYFSKHFGEFLGFVKQSTRTASGRVLSSKLQILYKDKNTGRKNETWIPVSEVLMKK